MRSVLDYPMFPPEHHRTLRIFLQSSLHAHRYVIDASTRAQESTAAAEYVRTEITCERVDSKKWKTKNFAGKKFLSQEAQSVLHHNFDRGWTSGFSRTLNRGGG
jgi:hypothetical protein